MKKTRTSLSNLKVVSALGAISQIDRHLTGIDVKYYLAENSKALRDLTQIWSEHRDEIAKEHTEKNEDGSPKTKQSNGQETYVWMSPEDKETGSSAFRFLDDIEIEVPAYRLPLERLSRAEKEDSRITIASLAVLTWMIQGENDGSATEQITISNSDAINAISAMNALNSSLGGIKAKYALALNYESLSKPLKAWTDERNRIIKEHARHDDNGDPVTEIKDEQEIFVWKSTESKSVAMALFKDNDAAESEVRIHPVSLSLLMEADKPDSSAPVEAFEAILWMIKLDTED